MTDREGWEMDLPAPAPPSQPLTSLQTSVAASQHGATLWDRATRLFTAAVISLASYFMDSIWNISSSLRLRFISSYDMINQLEKLEAVRSAYLATFGYL